MVDSIAKNVLGVAMNTIYSNAKINIDPYGDNGLKVMGMPMFYSPLDDPGHRSYSSTFETDLPLVFIRPGRPKINQKLFSEVDGGGVFELSAAFAKFGNAVVNTAEYLFTGDKSWRDARWMTFEDGMSNYMSGLNILLEQVRGAMGLVGDSEPASKFIDPTSAFGLAYYTTKGTDISESASNEYSMSSLASEANQKQQDIRDKRMLAESGGASIADKLSNWVTELTKQMADIPVIGGFVASVTENLDGSQFYYPDIWMNSMFERQYSMEFKFYSPYGDAQSIYNYVYVPFLTLLAMVLPIQDSYYSYKQPYIMKISAPGHFECDMGVVRTMNITKGGDNKWSSEKLPREITVNMTISDMYPNMMLSEDDQHLQYNYGLLSYLDALAGISYDQLAHTADGKREISIPDDRTSGVMSYKVSKMHKQALNLSDW